MASSVTSSVYANVIEDVMNKCRDEFIDNGGPGESVLNELQALWELKMMQAGAIVGPIDRSASQKAAPGGPIPPNPVHDLNVPYEGTEEYETPTADLLFPPTPLQTPLPGTAQTPLPGSAQTPLTGMSDSSSLYNIHSGATPITPDEYSSLNDNGGVHNMKAGSSRPSPYMQAPSPWLNQRPPLDVNVAYVEGREEGERRAPHLPSTQDFFTMPSGKRKREDFPSQQNTGGYIPQQDGAGDMISDDVMVDQGNSSQHVLVNATQQMVVQREGLSSTIPQLDGPMPDPYDDMLSTPNIYNFQGVANEDYNIVNTPAPHEMQAPTPAPAPQSDIADDDEDEPLNEDDDDDDLDDVDQGVDLNTAHLVLAQFDKVTRTKSRWKCNLKDGIMHINNKDILFNKATGEFEF
ncbi:transcription initiation factor IIA large subunit-like isoform X1 [Olea europaea var. sylvestris]|uniref:transcription initiation factor IIA large subunit-like isoform X1 n=1 Tax=Olea europaea var. sylvestris TaxID=158386 RepID=UPI000C1D605B|nr:transcription initiation factor IIA large subunit-like isoform X1 [Olea europaea var. sylvestris]